MNEMLGKLKKKVKTLFNNDDIDVERPQTSSQLQRLLRNGRSGPGKLRKSADSSNGTGRGPPPSCTVNDGNNIAQLPPLLQPPLPNHTHSVGHPQPVSQVHLYLNNDQRINLHAVENVYMNNPTIFDVQGNQNVNHSVDADPWVLNHLAGRAMLGAAFDSSARDQPPRCHPGTRQSILRLIRQTIHELEQKAQILWLYGPAGVGKSAIMQTLADAEAENNSLVASIFFSRPNDRNDSQKVFPTISYQYAVNNQSYQHYVAQQVTGNPSFLDRSMERQFNDLIAIPFFQHQQFLPDDSCVRIIILDGLDECKGEQEQCRIIEIIHDFVSRHPNVLLKWVIASRPEEHLRVAFSQIEAGLHIWKKDVPIDSDEGVSDVERYLHDKFTKIQKLYPRLIPAYEVWPSEGQFLKISSAASGLFVFASTIIRVIDDPSYGNPVSRLKLVISVLEKRPKGQELPTNPFEMLDMLYRHIMSEIPVDTLTAMKLVLGYLILRPRIDKGLPGHPFWICNILGLKRHILYGGLQKLRSVLDFPEPEDSFDNDVRFLHASFSDYLENNARSGNYSINLDNVTTHLWDRFITILLQRMKDHSHENVELSWSTESLMMAIRSKHGKKYKKPVLDSCRILAYIARDHWPTLIRMHLANKPSTMHLLPPLPDLLGQLIPLDYTYPDVLRPVADDTNDLIECLECRKDQIPDELYQKLIRRVSIKSIDKQRFLLSIYERGWMDSNTSSVHAFVGDDFSKTREDFGNDFEKIERFLQYKFSIIRNVVRLMEDAYSSKIMVTILGAPSRGRALLQIPNDLNPEYSTLCTFPYFEQA